MIISPEELLQMIPQHPPFRFVDKILEVNEHRIVGTYRFREDEFFYKGHFPEKPITPGVILMESMGQIGVVAFGMYQVALEAGNPNEYFTFLSDGSIELFAPVYPNDELVICGEKIYWRKMKMKSKIEMFRGDTLVASSVLSGVGVRR